MATAQFQCPECSQEFETQDELDQHIQQIHPMAPVPGDETDDERPEDTGRGPDGDSEPRDNTGNQY